MTDPAPHDGESRDDSHDGTQDDKRSRRRAALGGWLRSLTRFGGRAGTLRESVEELVEEGADEAGAIDEQERIMLRNLLHFGERRVEDVMVPRADIVAVPASASLADVVEAMAAAGHSRLPVFAETLDDAARMVHVRDLLAYWRGDRPFDIDAVARDVPFVPPSMPIRRLLRQMRATRLHMALVVDEHGGIDGLVTIEDIVEEIVGEIEDEHDRAAPPPLVERADGSFDASARASVETLERRLGVDLLPPARDERIDTLGGLIFALAGRVPGAGEVIRHECGIAFEVLEANPRRIRRVRVRPGAAPDGPDDKPDGDADNA